VAVDAGRRGRKPELGLITASDIAPLRSRSFFASMPSMSPSRAGILPGVVGTLLVMLVTMILAIPLGVAAGIYLEEYAPKNRLTALIELNIANLAGVPSIIWGLAGLALFIFALHLERSVLSAGLTLGLLVLPIVIISTREAIRAVPNTVREAALALGATKWQATRYHVLPYSMGGILTGSIIAMSRAIGETAPLVVIGAVLFISFLPPWPVQTQPPFVNLEFLNSKFTVVPMQVFDWVSRPQPEFHANAAAASLVLLAMTLGLNAIAIALRLRARKSFKW
jgi:phosphate transport system permease protein